MSDGSWVVSLKRTKLPFHGGREDLRKTCFGSITFVMPVRHPGSAACRQLSVNLVFRGLVVGWSQRGFPPARDLNGPAWGENKENTHSASCETWILGLWHLQAGK